MYTNTLWWWEIGHIVESTIIFKMQFWLANKSHSLSSEAMSSIYNRMQPVKIWREANEIVISLTW